MMKKLLLFGLLFCLQVSYASDNKGKQKKEMSMHDQRFFYALGTGCVASGAGIIANRFNLFQLAAPIQLAAPTIEYDDAMMVTAVCSIIIAYGAAAIYVGHTGNPDLCVGGSVHSSKKSHTSKKQN